MSAPSRLCVRTAVLAGALAACTAAAAQEAPLAPTQAVPEAQFVQHVDAALPLALPVVDAQGRRVRLGSAFDSRPVILVLGYYRCPQLCGLLMHGVLEALYTGGLPRDDYRVVGVSIDPQDTPATALARQRADRAYADFLLGDAPHTEPIDLRLYTAAPADIARLAREVGFRFTPTAGDDSGDSGAARFAHPAGIVIATPQGRISRYLMGVRFDAGTLRTALQAAADGRTGAAAGEPADGIGQRLALLCAHIDPKFGRYDGAVMQGMRALSLALLLLIGWGFWHLARGTRSHDEHRD
jgi:protein SCO1/2